MRGTLLGRGRTADVYEWGSRQILKLYHATNTDEHIEREARNTRLAFEAGAPAPAVFESVVVDGRRGTVFERIDGPSLQHALVEHPLRLWRYARLLAELQARLHAMRAPALPAQRGTMTQRLRAASLPTQALRAAV